MRVAERLGIIYLLAQAIGAALWWAMLLVWPATRQPFLAQGAPDATLLAFGVADLFLYAGASVLCAYGIARRRKWTWPLLCVHAGAAVYASLYCWTLTVLTGGDGLLGSLLMSPSLIFPGLLAWILRPRGAAC